MVSMNELKQDMITGMGYIGLDSGRLYRMRRGPKLIEAVASGTTIIINDATEGRPFRGLRVFGKSTQVSTTGANLLPFSVGQKGDGFEVFADGIQIDVQKYTAIYILGREGFSYESSYDEFALLTAGVYYIYSDNANVEMYINAWRQGKGIEIGAALKGSVNKMVVMDGDKFRIFLAIKGAFNGKVQVMISKIQPTEANYEPYTGGKPSPSPEYPQGIVSAGEGGSITVEVGGKNLLTGRLYFINYSNDIPHVRNEDEVALPYAPSSETHGIGYVVPCKPGVQYTFSVTNPNKNWWLGIAEYENFEQAKSVLNKIGYQYGSEKSSIKYTAVGNGVLVCAIAGKWTDGKTTIHECTESELLQLEIGSEATTYEPPRIPQSLTLATPNGLPGVSVSKDGNYTDKNGQQWVCDEIDLERGKYVQRVAEKDIYESQNTWGGQGTWGNIDNNNTLGFHSYINGLNGEADWGRLAIYAGMCNYFGLTSNLYQTSIIGFTIGDYVAFRVPRELLPDWDETNPSSEPWTNWLRKQKEAGNPVIVRYALKTSIERDLTPEEITAYKALRTYGPTTVVSNDAGAEMEVTYVADRKEN